MKGFKNVKAYVRGEGIVRADIGIENGRIAEINGASRIDEVLFDCGELLLVPGFLDTHIHGAGGADVMDGTRSALSVMSETLVKEGTTAFLATTMTQSEDNMSAALSAVADCASSAPCGARILGANSEGPFVSTEYAGAQPREYIVAPSVALFDKLNAAAKGTIKIATVAPENDVDFSLIEHLKKLGVISSVGHSAATESVVRDGIRRGLSRVTHTFNAQSALRHREIGVAGSALLYDELYCELIADGIHVSPSAMRLLLKNKPHDKVVLITDSMRAKGMPDGVYELGGQTVNVHGGKATLADGTLAGSVLKMNIAVKNIAEKCGEDICAALDLATYNPAASIGIADEYGSIKIGCLADFTLLDDDFDVVMTAVDGRVVYVK